MEFRAFESEIKSSGNLVIPVCWRSEVLSLRLNAKEIRGLCNWSVDGFCKIWSHNALIEHGKCYLLPGYGKKPILLVNGVTRF